MKVKNTKDASQRLGDAAEEYVFRSDHAAFQELRACAAEMAIDLLKSLEGPHGMKIEKLDIGESVHRYSILMLETFIAGARGRP